MLIAKLFFCLIVNINDVTCISLSVDDLMSALVNFMFTCLDFPVLSASCLKNALLLFLHNSVKNKPNFQVHRTMEKCDVSHYAFVHNTCKM